MSNTLAVIALVASLASLAVAFASYRQSKKTESLALRREAIHHVQAAFHDVVDGHITTKTVESIREATQLAKLLFSNNVEDPLKQAQSAASRLQHIPIERQTDEYYKGKTKLGEDLDTALERMNKEAHITGWRVWL
jgi:hypothetical protein